ncbi:hypothetical protein J1N10_11805 [Carboxylicivirga sp. A043]|uniref:hypothetical protein n=1 Tax=Carboxylicivirga litoralis TaxID=2816963 RepID=UPI0021CB307E|nr:hypothetical protein [Carboxylicivirga sp. A043]MCU4156663.1 hypothetical protein [Carboxylicivirga sp. A043]
MPDSWEEYFEKKRAEQDVYEPEVQRMWHNIDKELKRPAIRWRSWLSKAAIAVGVIFAVGWFVRHEMMMQAQINSLAAINKELAQQETSYINQVNLKWDEFKSMPSVDIELDRMLLDELALLDTIYNNGLNDIKQHGYNERAVLIMLDTYEKRLRIIERLISEKRKTQKNENKSQQISI